MHALVVVRLTGQLILLLLLLLLDDLLDADLLLILLLLLHLQLLVGRELSNRNCLIGRLHLLIHAAIITATAALYHFDLILIHYGR